jgi:hypothetical protein
MKELIDFNFMSDKPSTLETIPLPPRLPQSRDELDRSIMLLGNRKQADLNKRARRELERLLGAYPTVEEAALWKRMLRRACLDNI